MANAPITFPRLFQTLNPFVAQRSAQTDGSNTFVAGQFVGLAANVLAAIVADFASGPAGIYGLALDPSHAPTDEAYTAPFGELHNVVDPRNAVFLMNLTDASGTIGSGVTRQQDVTVGLRYSGTYFASPYGTVIGVDISDVGTAAKNVFKVIGLYNTQIDPLGDAAGDFNGRVLVMLDPSGVQ